MMAESADLQKGQLVFDNPPIETGTGSINSEQYEVEIRDSNRQARQAGLKVASPEQLAEIKRKCNQLETDKYFALKVSEIWVDFRSVFYTKLERS